MHLVLVLHALAVALVAGSAPALSAEETAGATAGSLASPVARTVAEAPADAAGPVVPRPAAHIALILPSRSRDFARAAAAVAGGFDAARQRDSGEALPVQVYAIEREAEQIGIAYREALARGAVTVVGGLTRSGALALAANEALVITPTLVLNQLDHGPGARVPLYSLSLSLEVEARQVAHLAESDGVRRIAVVAGASAAARRGAEAFAREFSARGGEVVGQWPLKADQTLQAALKNALQATPYDALFAVAEPAPMRRARPYFPPDLPIYSTSQVNDGKAGPDNADLAGIRLLEMPWFADPNSPAVATFPRPKAPLSPDLERLYALGIDAYRLAALLTRTGADLFTSLDGVTGRITLVEGYRFERELTVARFEDGRAVAADGAL